MKGADRLREVYNALSALLGLPLAPVPYIPTGQAFAKYTPPRTEEQLYAAIRAHLTTGTFTAEELAERFRAPIHSVRYICFNRLCLVDEIAIEGVTKDRKQRTYRIE